MSELTLLRRGSPLSGAAEQRNILATRQVLPPFEATLVAHRCKPLQAAGIEVLQINVGKLCNQTCSHCHVDAGPDRREIMSRETAEACIRALADAEIGTLDITGGAPEMNPHFRWLVSAARGLGCRVIDRCNLTILLAPGFTDLPDFLSEHQVEIVASLPCYLQENCDAQRGAGVFRRSITALQKLNNLGYGTARSGLELTLVYNPVGPSLPPPQEKLEAAYRRELQSRYGIFFSRLVTITNMPISRFLDDLLRNGEYEAYLQKLREAFNPATVAGLMCRTMISVDWEGWLYDCDFNQMLELPLVSTSRRNIRDFDIHALRQRKIATGVHCYGCTAGAGSSCGGALVAAGTSTTG